MDDRKINAFLLIVEKGSIRRAAEELGYSQSALSQMIQTMEAELGVPLLKRSHSGIALTKEGASLLPAMKKVKTEQDRLMREARELQSRRHMIRIGTYASIGREVLPALIRDVQEKDPGFSCEITIGANEITDLLETGGIDVAIIDEEAAAERFSCIPFLQDEYCAVVPGTLADRFQPPVPIRELYEYPLILPSESRLAGILEQEPFRRKIPVRAVDDTAILSMVSQGIGVSILPRLIAEQGFRNVSLLELKEAWPRTLVLACQKHAGKEVRKFAGFAGLKRIPQ